MHDQQPDPFRTVASEGRGCATSWRTDASRYGYGRCPDIGHARKAARIIHAGPAIVKRRKGSIATCTLRS